MSGEPLTFVLKTMPRTYKALPPGEKRTKFCKMLLHFLNPGVDYGGDFDNIEHAAAAVIDVSDEEWITVIIGALEYKLNEENTI